VKRLCNGKSGIAAGAAFVLAAAFALAALPGCGASGGSASPTTSSLVFDMSFSFESLDPGRAFDFTSNIVDHALYQQLLTFNGADVSKPVDGLASYALSDQDKVLTLTMKGGAKFSDGTPVTVDDAVFSLTRLQGIAGNPSFLLQGVKIAKTSATTLTLTSPTPNPTLPYILPCSSLGIVNSKVVKEHGGTTNSNDKAETFLNNNSAGSGPYILVSSDPTSKIVLKANPNYNGPKPAKSPIILRNVAAAVELLDIQAGDAQIALDLNPNQVKQLDAASFNIQTVPSRYTIYIMLNQSPKVSPITSNPKFDAAVKLGLDYDKLSALAGPGAQRLAGLVPSQFVGALPVDKGLQYSPDAAKQALKESGYQGQPVALHYANDTSTSGILFEPIAETVQFQLKAIGINITLAPSPEATELTNYRAGKENMGIWSWGADYPDPQDYLPFLPGGSVGMRAGWAVGANKAVEALGAKAATASRQTRSAAYQALQIALNEQGPFIPLIQPVVNIVAAKSISAFTPSVVWNIDLASIK
jgi:peptide/nickel transport system substrate-binding protein